MKKAIGALVLLSLPYTAWSANPESVTVNVTFVDAITMSTANHLNFGLVDSAMAASETIMISPDDTVTDTNNRRLGGIAEAAEVTVSASAGQAITISVDNIVGGVHYNLGSPTCKYDVNTSVACTSYSTTSVASGALLIGMTLTRNSVAMTPGVDNGSFEVNVTYN
ncbi:DUF4402 domain-containing protein [Alteromonas ponticola]|uniref:DUF4402 domain-containing protein n=2 Tax=Alteromonas aquimaris TaxID=2998417 RepID=A0ABT3PAY3_9ALTE|nr:DUF4402 domain-containing protein [Alteromonas aquimaris]